MEKQIFKDEAAHAVIVRKKWILYPDDMFKIFWDIYMTL
jgi:hypothetical protein